MVRALWFRAARLYARAVRGARLAWNAARSPSLWPALAGSLLFGLAFLVLDPLPARGMPLSRALYARGGELLGAAVAADGQWRLPPSPSALPKRYVIALTAYEDKRFFGHAGFDPWAILRAARDNISRAQVVSGGSTLSMQAARLSRPQTARTLGAKLLELWAAVRLEALGTKSSILARYASLAPFGGNVVGLEAAGFRWFGRPPVDLTWAEAATLAVLPNNPGAVHPGRYRDYLSGKRDALLKLLAARGIISGDELYLASHEELPKEPQAMPSLAPHLTQAVPAGRGDSTLDWALQSRVKALAERHATRLRAQGIANAAVVVLRVADGTVAAWVGNVDSPETGDSPHVDCALAPRSSGSILKPFLYAAMLGTGELSPGRIVPDIPTRVGSYSPENNLKTYAGAVRADEALAKSLNVPFVRLLRSYGVERFGDLLKRLGFGRTMVRATADYGLTLILGGAEVSLADAAAAYALLARNALGLERLPATYRWLQGRAPGASIQAGDREGGQFPAGAAWLTLDALVSVGRPADEASWQEYASSYKVAWKTGTSFGSRDGWAIGVTGDWVVAVWTGNASGEGRPGLKGTDSAAPLMFDVFGTLPRSEWFPKPQQALKTLSLCADSGFVAGPDCARVVRAEVPIEANVDLACPYCVLVHLSPDGRERVSAQCAGPGGMVAKKRFVLPPAMEWYYRRSSLDYRPLPPWKDGCAPAGEASMAFIVPEEGSSIYVPIELDGSPGQTVFRLAARDPEAVLFWHLDEEYLGSTRGEHALAARPSPGLHELRVLDQNGASVARRFTVLAPDP